MAMNKSKKRKLPLPLPEPYWVPPTTLPEPKLKFNHIGTHIFGGSIE